MLVMNMQTLNVNVQWVDISFYILYNIANLKLGRVKMSYYNSEDHKNECENVEYYYCKDCKELVHQFEKNFCPTCLMFIPKFDKVIDCICDLLPNYEPDYDSMRKYALENPDGRVLV